jgi:hypothetical protein
VLPHGIAARGGSPDRLERRSDDDERRERERPQGDVRGPARRIRGRGTGSSREWAGAERWIG